jgi:hypothetical protein
VGSTCILFTDTCALGTFCRSDPPGDGGLSPTTGTCQPYKKVGETCPTSEDLCEPLANCFEGKCIRCN